MITYGLNYGFICHCCKEKLATQYFALHHIKRGMYLLFFCNICSHVIRNTGEPPLFAQFKKENGAMMERGDLQTFRYGVNTIGGKDLMLNTDE